MERKFQEKLKSWQKTEAELEKRRLKEAERERDLSKEQRKALERELEYSSDEEAERYESQAAQKRIEERRLLRLKEQ